MDAMDESEKQYYTLDNDQIDDAMFTREVIKNVLLYEKSLHLVGIVRSTEARSSFLKFTLTNNKTDDVCECIIWDSKTIDEMKHKIVVENVFHVYGGFARKKHATSMGNMLYDITIASNTLIRVLRTPVAASVPSNNQTITSVSIEDCCKVEGVIEIEAYIKNPISEMTIHTSFRMNQGCLSDCNNFKLEMRMPSLCSMKEFIVGSHVKVIGTIKYSQYPYIWVVRKEDVKFASDTKHKITEVLKGRNMPKRIKTEESSENNKKMKM